MLQRQKPDQRQKQQQQQQQRKQQQQQQQQSAKQEQENLGEYTMDAGKYCIYNERDDNNIDIIMIFGYD